MATGKERLKWGWGGVGSTSTYSKDWGEGDGYPKKENRKYYMKAYLNTSQLKNKKSRTL